MKWYSCSSLQRIFWTCIFPLILRITPLTGKPNSKDNEDSRLMHHLLDDYDNRVYGHSEQGSLHVNLGFTLIQLHSLDEKNQMLTSSGWFQVEWKDIRLMWNISEYNRTNIVIPSRELWLPDIGFLNSASVYHNSMIKNEFRCIVYHTGDVLWVPGGTYYTTCELDISRFPFDKQNCFLHLTNWAYNLGEMNLSMSNTNITMDSYKPSAEWAIIETKINRSEVFYECCGNVSYPSLYFHIWIQRKSLYYIVNIITPCVILSLLATFTFCVPPDSGEKISLGITLLLSFTVFQLIVAESIPRRSDSVPIISIYISAITGVVTLSIISAILICHIHHRGAVKLPYSLRRFAFNFLARLLCMSDLVKKHGVQTSAKWKTPRHTDSLTSMSSTRRMCRIKLLNGTTPVDEIRNTEHISEVLHQDFYMHKLLQETNSHMEHIIEALKEHEARRSEDESDSYKVAEWQAVGKVFDRFFFLVFVLSMMFNTGIIVVPAAYTFIN